MMPAGETAMPVAPAPPVSSGIEAWQSARGELAASQPNTFQHWLADLEAVSLEQDTLRLRARSAFVASYVERQLITAIQDALRPHGISRVIIIH
ncbi:MAG: DnaA N-terminal domain-containing protein [Pseudomonadota bacterium]